jgi:hypothetical protein
MIMHGEGHVYVGVWMQRDTYIDTEGHVYMVCGSRGTRIYGVWIQRDTYIWCVDPEGHVYMVCGSRGTRICRRDMIMIEECTRNGHVN